MDVVKSYIAVSTNTNSSIGSDQTSVDFWNAVQVEFEKRRPLLPGISTSRTGNALKVHFTKLQLCCRRFHRFYVAAKKNGEHLGGASMSEEEVIEDALALWKGHPETVGGSFKSLEQWKIIKHLPKYATAWAKMEEIRPPGKKKAKIMVENLNEPDASTTNNTQTSSDQLDTKLLCVYIVVQKQLNDALKILADLSADSLPEVREAVLGQVKVCLASWQRSRVDCTKEELARVRRTTLQLLPP